MQALTDTLRTILARMKGMSATAQMLIGALMVILVMGLFLVSLYSGRRDMTPLGLSAALPPEARDQAVDFLRMRSIPHEVQGHDVLVPPSERFMVLAALTDNEVITPAQINFDTIVAEDSPFLSKHQNEKRWLVAKMNVVAATISRMKGIERAVVVIDEPRNAGGIGRSHIPPTASVNVTPSGSALTQAQVDAIAELVAGSHVGLAVENVAVIDAKAGQSRHARGDDLINASANLELQMSQERLVQEKIARALDYIPGVRVAVNVMVDTREEFRRASSYEEPKIAPLEELTHTRSSRNAPNAAVAGVQPNVGAAIASSAGRGSEMSDERTEARTLPMFPASESSIRDHNGHPLQINATVGVPKSYFVQLFRSEQGDEAAEPTPEQLDAIVQSEIERLRTSVEPLTDTGALDHAVRGTVVVSMIPDFAVAAIGGVGVGGGAGGSTGGGGSGGGAVGTLIAEGWVQNAGLLALALLSVFMMVMLVRRTTAQQELPSAEELVGVTPSLAEDQSELVGEADESPAVLEGLEINEEDVRRQHILTQINELVEQSPDVAATLLRKWIKAT